MSKSIKKIEVKYSFVFSTDIRHNIIQALKNSNLIGIVNVSYPFNNGLQVDFRLEYGNIQHLFTLGRFFGQIEHNKTAHIKNECFKFFCEHCGTQENGSNFFKNICKDCAVKHQEIINTKNEKMSQNKEPPKEPEPQQTTKTKPFKIILNPNNFKK